MDLVSGDRPDGGGGRLGSPEGLDVLPEGKFLNKGHECEFLAFNLNFVSEQSSGSDDSRAFPRPRRRGLVWVEAAGQHHRHRGPAVIQSQDYLSREAPNVTNTTTNDEICFFKGFLFFWVGCKEK